MNEAWIVSVGSYSDEKVIAVCSTKEKAEVIQSRLLALSHNDVYVYAVPLDPEYPSHGMPAWTVYVDTNGEVHGGASKAMDALCERVVAKTWVTSTGWEFTVFARDEDHAIKIATDLRKQELAKAAGVIP